MFKLLIFISLAFSITMLNAAPTTISENIKIDQFGYRPADTKVAVIAQPQSGAGSPSTYTPAATFKVKRWSDDAEVFSATITAWNSGATHTQSGDKAWWFDFSSFTTAGDFFKSLEITRGEDGSAHPHLHILLMVEPKYFGKNYIKQKQWIEMWRKALRIDYDPTAHIQSIKDISGNDNLLNAVKEVAKYTVKGDDLIAEKGWLEELTRQVHKTRAISVGGILKKYLSEEEATNEELVLGEVVDDSNQVIDPHYLAQWDKLDSRYTVTELTDE